MRDKLLSGDLDAAHVLYGLVYGVQLGLGGPQTDMAVLMVLNRNGQAITLSNRLADALAEHGTLPKALATLGRKPVFAQTFPTGTHAMWLYYWLASQGVHPLRDIESVAIPPPQMVAALAEESSTASASASRGMRWQKRKASAERSLIRAKCGPIIPRKCWRAGAILSARIRIRRERWCRPCSKRAAGSTVRGIARRLRAGSRGPNLSASMKR